MTNNSRIQSTLLYTFHFTPNDKGNPPGKLADAEIHFTAHAGPALAGLKLIGFAIWERKNGGRNVTFPARQYSVNGERRSFALLRPHTDAAAQETLRDAILDAYAAHEQAQDEAERAAVTAAPSPVPVTGPMPTSGYREPATTTYQLAGFAVNVPRA